MPCGRSFPTIRAAVWAAALVLAVAASAAGAAETTMVKAVPVLPAKGTNSHYRGNRAPLLPTPLIRLPVGAVRANGWLETQLKLEADGFSGRLPEVSPWCQFDGSAWASPTGQGKNGWEELPYWLKGFAALGYVLDDRRVIAESRRWLDAILASQRPDGYFGPESNHQQPDVWPNMLALYALRTHYEATGDKRVLPFMLRYFQWEKSLPADRFLPNSWQKVRGGDNLDIVQWLYNETGEKWLVDLARENHEHTDDWTKGIASWHGVNLAQGFREPGQWYQQAGDPKFLQAAERNYQTARDSYGQVPGGLYGADENARPGYTGPRQGAETCTIAEMMWSDELLLSISGSPIWADRCEDVTFNTLPASMTPDLKGLHYLTAPNQVQLDRSNKSPMIQNGGDMFSYDPRSYRCCQHNIAFAWPYFAQHLWMATPGNGLAAVMYAPSTVTATVANGVKVTVEENTEYPFSEVVALNIRAPRAVRFPLTLRVPAWCAAPTLKLNGKALPVPASAKGWLVVDRTWKSGDGLLLMLPMRVQVTRWTGNRDTASISYGPLTYSLAIGEKWQKVGGDDRWPQLEVYPTTPWNYGIPETVLKDLASDRDFAVGRRAQLVAGQPFAPEGSPVSISIRARRIPAWRQEPNGMVGEVQPGPIRSTEPEETVMLIPMGCARLRITAFPVIGDGPDAHEWPVPDAVPSASFVSGDTPTAMNDGLLPKNSADRAIPRMTWWDHRGTTEWVQYDYAKPKRVGSAEVYWFDDEPVGGQCRVPASWRLLWWDGTAWKPVEGAAEYGTAKDRFNRVTFQPVETTKLRLEVQLKPTFSGGILEWKAGQ